VWRVATLPLALALSLTVGSSLVSAADEKPVPDGLTCPVEIAGGERISYGDVAPTPGVTGFCIYYLVGETDFEAVTMTLRITNADYDWQASFKAPKMEKGGMRVVEEGTLSASLGGKKASALVTTLGVAEEDLGPVTQSFSTLWVFDLGDGRKLSLEEEYNNVSEPMRPALREALLEAQSP
jgi:hypothetical protein